MGAFRWKTNQIFPGTVPGMFEGKVNRNVNRRRGRVVRLARIMCGQSKCAMSYTKQNIRSARAPPVSVLFFFFCVANVVIMTHTTT